MKKAYEYFSNKNLKNQPSDRKHLLINEGQKLKES
jgi:hypothetical protein